MENTQKNLSRTLFHTQVLASELKQLSLNAEKSVLQAWISNLGELVQKDKASFVSVFSTEILEKILGYSASGNTVTIAPDSTPDPYFDLLLGQFKPDGQQVSAALKLEMESSISSEVEKSFVEEAWKFTELENNAFYLLANPNEIRLYPKNRKEKVYERFIFSEMLLDDTAFCRFCLLLGATNLLSGKTAQWLYESALLFLHEKLTGSHPTFKNAYGSISRGITTGLDEAFIIDEAKKEALLKEDPRSADILKPYAENEDLDKWSTDSRSLWLIYTPENVYDIENYPAIKNHLVPFREKLEKRPGTQKWYELQHTGTSPEKMSNLKLGFSTKSHEPAFSVDKEGKFFGRNGLYATDPDYYLAALMNSSVIWYLIRRNSEKKEDGTYELTETLVENLPVPDAPGLVRGRMGQLSDFCNVATADRNAWINHFRGMTAFNLLPNGLTSKLTKPLHNWFAHEFEAFREEIIASYNTDIPADDLQLWTDYFYQERNKIFNMNADIARAEKEIDLLVYDLFGLTPDEIDLLERTV